MASGSHHRYSVARVDDIFTQSAARQYGLGNSSLATRPLVETTPYFTRRLFPEVLLAEPNLAGENSVWLNSSRRRLTAFFRLWRGAGGIAGRKLAPLLQSELAVRR